MIFADDNPEDAFAKAYEEYADAIFRHCTFRIFNRERGMELMQETFMRTWEYIAKGNDIENVQAFLYRTANNIIVDEIRRKMKRREDSLEEMIEQGFEPGTDDDAETMKSNVDGHRLMDVLREVEEPYRTALVMRYIDGFSPAEIAEATGESPNTISVRIHRGTEKLRALATPSDA